MKIDFNAKDNKGNTALHMAIGRSHVNVVKMFMDNSASLSIDVNSADNLGQTAFHMACLWGGSNVVKMLMNNSTRLSIDLNAKDNAGRTAYSWACESTKELMLKIANILEIDLGIENNQT